MPRLEAGASDGAEKASCGQALEELGDSLPVAINWSDWSEGVTSVSICPLPDPQLARVIRDLSSFDYSASISHFIS